MDILSETQTHPSLLEILFSKKQQRRRTCCARDRCLDTVGKSLLSDSAFANLALFVEQFKEKGATDQGRVLAKCYNKSSARFLFELSDGHKLKMCNRAVYHFFQLGTYMKEHISIILMPATDPLKKILQAFFEELFMGLKEMQGDNKDIYYTGTSRSKTHSSYRSKNSAMKIGEHRFRIFWDLYYPQIVSGMPMQEEIVGSNPNDEETRLHFPSNYDNRPKILCLGMSYPQLHPSTDAMQDLQHIQSAAVEALGPHLTAIDGRDWIRVRVTEEHTKTKAYTVSLEKAAQYKQSQHLSTNFSLKGFKDALLDRFGTDILFVQIALDYYYIPGPWADDHWPTRFFRSVLCDLVHLLDWKSESELECAIYLPCCCYVFCEIVDALPVLETIYAISFLERKDLHEVALWEGTQLIDYDVMRDDFEKEIDQEEFFTLDETTVRGKKSHYEPYIKILRQMRSPKDTKMIKLRPLQSKDEKGGLQLPNSMKKKAGARRKQKQPVGKGGKRKKRK